MKNTNRVAGFDYYYLASNSEGAAYFPYTQQGRSDAIAYSDNDDMIRVGGFAVIDDSRPGHISKLYPSAADAESAIKSSNSVIKSRKSSKNSRY